MLNEKNREKNIKVLEDIEFALNEASIVAITDKRGNITFVNNKFCKISQYNEEELIGERHNIINSGHHPKSFFQNMWKTITSGKVWNGEIKNKRKDGSYYWVDTTIVPFLDNDGIPFQYVSIRHEITKLKEYEKVIEKMAYYDQLTLLRNRNGMNEWLKENLLKHNETITVLFLDIDRFKSINDLLGHRAGDILLQKFAKRLKNSVRNIDLVARQGGDEFVILLKNMSDRNQIIAIVDKIKEQISLEFIIKNKRISITTSIGINIERFTADTDYLTFTEMAITKADQAMYYAKKTIGNAHYFSTNAQSEEIKRYYLIESEIKKALENQEFSVVYQPIVLLESNQLIGVEALLRWENPLLGKVSPSEFAPVLEETGLIIPVGEWVIHTVCLQMKAWHQRGIHLEKASINVSPIQFGNSNMHKVIHKILQQTRLEAKYISIEITEGTILDMGDPINTLTKMKELGVSIAIDDFGTGYSSLSYLKQLPVDTIKIDKLFLDKLNGEGEVLLNTIITLGRNLRYNIIAEGIERQEQIEYLIDQGCPEGQGNFWSIPIPEQQVDLLYEQFIEKKY